MMFVVYLLYAIFFSACFLRINKLNENPHRLTVRGKRVLFAVLFVVGLVLVHAILNLNLLSVN